MVIVIVVIAAFLISMVAILYYFSKRTFARGNSVYDIAKALKDEPTLLDRISDGKNEVEAMPFERHTITSHDGLRLVGKLYRADGETNKYIICMHGYRSSNDDFTCAMGFFVSQGYNVLAISQRAHGESEGKWITFGVKERYDALSWCNYLIKTYGDDIKIVLDGMSMGATTVLMASGLDLPKNVKGVIADCGFTSPWDIVTHVAKHDMHIPKFPLLYLMLPAVKLICDFGLKKESTVNAIKRSKLPILLVHGLSDDFVPHEMSVRAYNARPENTRLISVENATHGMSFVVDEERCKKELGYFLNEVTEKGHF
ncbi:MAG: alpha/beta hydrolase [Clostridia bacterium]|nr:alpha/beta hydrolase [Clostridia bacterium]